MKSKIIKTALIFFVIFIQPFNGKQKANAVALNEIDTYFLNLPRWQDISPPINDDPGTVKGKPVTNEEGKYECIDQDYSLAKTPEAIVVFDNTSAALWPGSIIQGKPYRDGYFEQLPLSQQAPIELTSTLLIPEPSVLVENPSKQSMQTAISALVLRGKDSTIPAELDFNLIEVYSLNQTLLDFNLSAKYLNQRAKAALKVDNNVETKTISAYLVQKMFTVSVPMPKTPSSYFNNISMSEIEDQRALGRIGEDNPPLYVESVSYGRILLFTMTSKASQTDIQAALDYSYHGGADIDEKTKVHYNNILTSAEIKVLPYGGRYQDAAKLIRSAKIADYFSDEAPPLTTAVPISYKLNTLARGVTAKVAEVTTYTERNCHIKTAPAVKKNDKFTLQYVGGGDNRYLSISAWMDVGLAGKYPYPTLQLRPVQLQFRGGKNPLTTGSNIRFVTLEGKSGGRDLGNQTELGAWNAKKLVFYDKPDASSKQNWIFTKKCGSQCDKYIRYGDKVNIRNEKKSKQYLCNDSDKKSRYLITKNAKCTWMIRP